jgi:MFS family permease
VGSILGIMFLRADRPAQNVRHPLDVLGLILICPAMVSIVYGLSQPAQYGWGSFQVLGPLIAGGLLLLAFVLVELRQRFPLLDIRVFKDPAFSGAQLLVFLIAATLFGAVFLMPLFLQQVQGMGTLKSGFILAFQGVAAALMMPISGILTDKIGARKIVPFGVLVLTAASLWTATISYNTSEFVVIMMMFSRGLGMGLTMMPAMSAAYVTLRPEQVAPATAITNVVQRVAAAIGVAILSTILTNRIAANLPHIPGHAIGGSTASLAALNLPPQIKDILLQQASKGFDATFLIAAGLGVLCLPGAFLLQRARSAKEVRDYAVGQLRQGVVLGTAALRVRDDGAGRLSPEASESAFSALARSGKARIDKAAMLMRLGTNAGGLVPRPPLSPRLKAAVGAAAMVGLVCAVAGFIIAFRTPDVPNILPLLAQLPHPGAPPGH